MPPIDHNFSLQWWPSREQHYWTGDAVANHTIEHIGLTSASFTLLVTGNRPLRGSLSPDAQPRSQSEYSLTIDVRRMARKNPSTVHLQSTEPTILHICGVVVARRIQDSRPQDRVTAETFTGPPNSIYATRLLLIVNLKVHRGPGKAKRAKRPAFCVESIVL